MKKKKFSFIKKLIFTLLFGFSSVSLLGGWTIDNNGNLQSDNLSDYTREEVYENGITSSVNHNVITASGSTENTYGIIKIYRGWLNSGTYTISATPYENTFNYYQWYTDDWSIDIQYQTITLSTRTLINCRIILHPNITISNYTGYIMLNRGSNPLPYEPYGTWYSQTNYEILENDISQLNEEIGELEEQVSDLQSSLEQITQEYEDYQDLINNTVGITSFDISQYSVSVGNVPNQPSFNYTKTQDITNNFTTIGYLNINDIYTSYIQSGNNNSIYITTPQSNLLTFDLIFNYISQPNTMLKTTLTLPDGRTQQFSYSSAAYDYKEEWTLANLVSSTAIGGNYNMNDISYKDLIITYESQGSILNEIKIGSNNGFNTGFNNGYNTSLNKINELQYELNTKTSLLEKANVDLQNKTNEYNMLLARYQQLTETPLQLNFQNLIWTIASSPFESFKQIWNVDILGFNIANFVIGVMSVFVVMYIIKKIF